MKDNKELQLKINDLEAKVKFLELAKIEMRDNIMAAAKSEGALPSLAALMTMHIENYNELDLIIERTDFGKYTAKVEELRKFIFQDFEAIGNIFGWDGQDDVG